MAMLNGESVIDVEVASLSEVDRVQITNALELIFQGLSLRNWLAGGVLRDAWQNSLDQLREFVFSITTVNPATVFARTVVFEMRTKWQGKMTLSGYTNRPIQCPDEKRADWINDADEKIRNGMDLLMQKINNFASGTPKTSTAKNDKSDNPMFQKIFDSRVDQERQRVRERKIPN